MARTSCVPGTACALGSHHPPAEEEGSSHLLWTRGQEAEQQTRKPENKCLILTPVKGSVTLNISGSLSFSSVSLWN